MRDNSAGQPTDLIEAQNSLDVKTRLFGRRACRLEALEEILLRARLERARVRTPAGGRQKEVGGGQALRVCASIQARSCSRFSNQSRSSRTVSLNVSRLRRRSFSTSRRRLFSSMGC